MHKTTFFILVYVLFFWVQNNYAQKEINKNDSLKLYKNIHQFSQKKKSTSFLYRLIFRPINPVAPLKNASKIDYSSYQGKSIRNIKIITLDPFGNKIQDSTDLEPPKHLKLIEKWGNRLHLKSKDYTIRKIVLFDEKSTIDSTTIKESIRLIRAQQFVNRVELQLIAIPENTNFVDVVITVLDSWSLIPNASFSGEQSTLKLKERNFLGQGHELKSEFMKRFEDGQNGHLLQYTIPNFRKTFVKIQATNQKDVEKNTFNNFDLSRLFISPLIKWGGGIAFEQHFRLDTLSNKNGVFSKQRFKYNVNDYWLGRAFSIKKGPSEISKITNLILAGRYLNVKFNESPMTEYDTIGFFSDEKLVLFSTGLNARNFVQERFIFNNGIIEDVPVGKAYSITTGYRRKNSKDLLYLGSRASFGNYFRWGFFSMNVEWGTFFENSKTTQTAFTFKANYFTKLYELGNWKIRQFIKEQVVIGNNRLPSIGDQITINEENGIPGFKNALYGTKKMVFSAQTQCYSPWNFLGFRLNPFFNYTIAVLGNSKKMNLKNQTFSSIGLGFLINNDYLVFNSFQFSLAYYPNTFNSKDNNIITNAFESSDFGLLDFELNKPRIVNYK